MKMKRSYIYILAAVLAALSFSSCLQEDIQVETMSFIDSELYVEVGMAYGIEVTIVPETAARKAVLEWASSDPEVATVDADGVVTGLKTGRTVITATAESGVNASATLHVTPVVEGLFLPQALTLEVGASTRITPSFAPEDAKTMDIAWESLKPEVATVDDLGTVTGISGGYAEITATYGEFADTCMVKVKTGVVGVELNVHEAHLLVEVDTLQLTAVVEPDNSLGYVVDWISSVGTVASVSATGVVTPLKPGRTVVRVVLDKSVEDSCVVTVAQPAKEVRLDRSEIELQRKETCRLNASVFPSNVSMPDVVWTSSNPSIASVDAQGNVSAVSLGEAVITVSTVDQTFEGVSASCKVKVTQVPLGISLSETSVNLRKDDKDITMTKWILYARLSPDDVTDAYRKVEWSSSDNSVATVSDGIVTATGQGTAVITARSEVGGLEAECEVTVVQAVTSVAILRNGEDAGQTGAINRGPENAISLTAVVGPEDAGNKEVHWSVSDPSVVTFDESTGLVTGIAVGTAILTVTTDDGGYVDTYELKVTNDLSEISLLSDHHIAMKSGDSRTIGVSCKPVDARISTAEAFVLAYDSWGDGSLLEKSPASSSASASAVINPGASGDDAVTVTLKAQQKGKAVLLVKLTDVEGVVCYDHCVVTVDYNEGFENEDEFGWD